MCGLIFAENFAGKPVNIPVLNQYEAQKNRGREGFGVFDRINGRLVRATKEGKMLGWIKNHPQSSIMFHHRFPTSTSNRKRACHPHSTRKFFDTQYVLIHNGAIFNSKLLKPQHEALGINYFSWLNDEQKFNDSESLLWDVALYLEGKQDKLKSYGNIAFICLAIPKDKRHPTKLYFARNHQPLNMQLDDENIMLSSEGEGEAIKSDTLYCYNYSSKTLSQTMLEVPAKNPYVVPTRSYTWPPSSQTSTPRISGFQPAWGNSWDKKEDQTHYYSSGRSYIGTDDYEDDYGLYDDGDTDIVETPEERPSILDMQLLSADIDCSWASLYPIIKSEVVYEKSDGVLYNVKDAVLERIDSFMESADGRYNDAYALLGVDLMTLRRQLMKDRDDNLVDDEDLLLEIDVLMLTREALDTCPYWATEESVDPYYALAATV